MRRVLVAAALLAVASCNDRGHQELQHTFDAASLALWRGDLAAAQTLSERGLQLSESARPARPPDQSWKFRHLKAEVLIARLDLRGSAPILETRFPNSRD